MGTQENLKKSVENWRDIVVFNAKNDSLRAFVDSVVSSSSDIDKTSNWAIGVAGAISGLLITNLDKLTPKFFEISEIKILLIILVSSILCGLAQKSLALTCSVHLKVTEATANKLKEIIDTFESSEASIQKMIDDHQLDTDIEFDIYKVIERFVNLSPFYIKWYAQKETQKVLSDPEYNSKKTLRSYYRQNGWLLLQAMFFMFFILFAVTSL
ncbi:hypothetical protein WNY51_07095 [Pseudocolwellia sp. AS88]|uniref:hypothetical protein n=1 Tax=Pseudocolwellia sp. AS88 TaxID=3063958 RepID=UPI0026EEACAE|nr:hypothetical protein [Pseudocolwellia sp. AS88]MDO7085718.1 hypothetical protein [Pseudocolwellia sp. AS88]